MKNRQQHEDARAGSGVSPPQAKTITEATLLKRINRKLASENLAMRKARRWTTDLGRFFVVDRHTGTLESAHHDDLMAFACIGGLVRPGERVEDGTASTEAR